MVNKTKRTVLNAVANITNTIVSSLVSFFLIRVVLLYMGSDYNGLHSTASQFLTVLTLFEGSFTIASQVALYKPIAAEDRDTVDGICSATRVVYRYTGIIVFLLGCIFAVAYSPFVKTSYDYVTVFFVIAISITSSSIASIVASKYRVLFQVNQKEYFVTFITAFFNLASNLVAYILVINHTDIITLRLSFALFSILSCLAISYFGRLNFKEINFHATPKYDSIKGTGAVMCSALTSMVYGSAPVFYLSTFLGTVYTSVFAVYNSIFQIVNSLVVGVLNAPKNGIGQVLVENDEKKKTTVFLEFELVTILFSTITLTSVYAVIIPFVKLYTAGVTDIQYVDNTIALIMVLYVFVQFIHIPSGTCMNMTGQFKAVRNYQILAGLLLLALLVIGGRLYGLYGILFSNLLTGLLLAFLEIRYTRKNIFKIGYKHIFLLSTVNLITASILGIFGRKVANALITDYFSFFAVGVLLGGINATVLIFVNKYFFPEYVESLVQRFKRIVCIKESIEKKQEK